MPSAAIAYKDEELRATLQRVQRYTSARLADTQKSVTVDRFNAADPTSVIHTESEEESPPLLVRNDFEMTPRPYVLHALQEWEGYVETIGSDRFTGVLIDKTAGDTSESERAEFALDDVSAADRELLREGAIFRWVIGYQVLQGGNRQRVSQIVFRRLPAWRRAGIDKARQRGRALIEALRGVDAEVLGDDAKARG